MKRFAFFVTALAALSLGALPAQAAPKQGKQPTPRPSPQKGKPLQLKISLKPNPAYADLATSKGKLDYQSKKFRSLKVSIQVPASAPSIGIVDALSAAAAVIHVELSRNGTVYADCTLAANAASGGESVATPTPAATPTPPSAFRYSLHVKTNGKHDVKGTCGNGSVPIMQKGDTIAGYALVLVEGVATRVNFLSK